MKYIAMGCIAFLVLIIPLIIIHDRKPEAHYTGHFQATLSSENFQVRTKGDKLEAQHSDFVGWVINDAGPFNDDRMAISITPITIDGVKYFIVQTSSYDGHSSKLVNVSMCPAVSK